MTPRGALAVPVSMGQWLERFRARLHQHEFWVVQALVILATAVHWSIHAYMQDSGPTESFAVVVMYAVYFVPIIYASLNFGQEGAIPTALWSTILGIPTILIWHHGIERITEGLQHATIIGLAVVIAGRVDHEIAARKQAEQESVARRASEARYRELFESAGDAILVFDPAGIVRDANAAAGRLLGRALNAMSGESLGSLLGAAGADLMLNAPGNEMTPRRELRLATPTSGTHWVTATRSVVQGNGNGTVIQALLHDVTEERERRRDLETYTRRVIQAQENERQRIARDLHDSTVQSVVLLCRQLDDLESRLGTTDQPEEPVLTDARKLAESIADELRRFSRDLRPSILDDLGLGPAVRWVVQDLSQRTGLQGDFRVEGTPIRLQPDRELALFRIAQEAVRNVGRHAAASRVDVTLGYDREHVKLTIADNGQGLPPLVRSLATGSVPKLGLLGMQERARLLGGDLKITSKPGKGTRIDVCLPLGPQIPDDDEDSSPTLHIATSS